MKVLYVSSTHSGMHESSIYYDLMQEFVKQGWDVTIAYSREKRLNLETELYFQNNIRYLGIKTGNISKNKNLIEKGISILTMDTIFKNSIKKYLGDESFDLILYSTPPITYIKTIKFLKKQSPNGMIYLMLKDIFPQNAVDIDLMRENSILHRFFRRKEKRLYQLVDFIGVMSFRNKEYFMEHNPEFGSKVEILPNSIKVRDDFHIRFSRKDFGISEDKVVFVYGGNLGFPQDIPFVIECAKALEKLSDVEMVVCGSGSQEDLITDYINKYNPSNFKYLGHLPKDKYDELVYHCDVGLIFLDHRFTIPNYPQRILSYMEAKLPVLCATDASTDVGTMAETYEYGYHVLSNDVAAFVDRVELLAEDKQLRYQLGQNAYEFLLKNFTVEQAYKILEGRLNESINNGS